MLGTLLESTSHRTRRTGSALLSATLHAGLLTLAVAATARAGLEPDGPDEVDVHYVQALAPPPPSGPAPAPAAAAAASAPTVAPLPEVPRLDVQVDIPRSIPRLDLTHAVTDPSRYTAAIPAGVGSERGVRDGWGGPDTATVLNATADKQAFMIPGQHPPAYPDVLRRSGVEGTVLVAFVLDTLGGVDPRSVEVLATAHDLFSQAVRTALARMRYSPAQVAGRRVRVRVQQEFSFVIKR